MWITESNSKFDLENEKYNSHHFWTDKKNVPLTEDTFFFSW